MLLLLLQKQPDYSEGAEAQPAGALVRTTPEGNGLWPCPAQDKHLLLLYQQHLAFHFLLSATRTGSAQHLLQLLTSAEMHKEPRQVKPVQGDSFQPRSVPADCGQLVALRVLSAYAEAPSYPPRAVMVSIVRC